MKANILKRNRLNEKIIIFTFFIVLIDFLSFFELNFIIFIQNYQIDCLLDETKILENHFKSQY